MRWVRCGSMHVALRFDQIRKRIIVIDGLFLNLNVLDNDTLVFSLVSKGHWNVRSYHKDGIEMNYDTKYYKRFGYPTHCYWNELWNEESILGERNCLNSGQKII